MPISPEKSAVIQAMRVLYTASRDQYGAAWGPIPTVTNLNVLTHNEIQPPFYNDRVQLPPPGQRVFPLPPIPRDDRFIPFLTMDWTFQPESKGFFRLYLVRREVPPEAPAPLPVHILRFDCAEGNDDWSFSHVQNCDKEDDYKGWTGIDKDLASGLVPKIPLLERNPNAPTLLLAVCLSIYGRNGVTRELLRAGDFAGSVPNVVRFLYT